MMPGGPAECMFQLRPPPFKYGVSFHQNGALVAINHCGESRLPSGGNTPPTFVIIKSSKIFAPKPKKQIFYFSMKTTAMCDQIARNAD
jgi:hypothetical protein